jgi:hypothetical protein
MPKDHNLLAYDIEAFFKEAHPIIRPDVFSLMDS